jgi:hypothetical protein
LHDDAWLRIVYHTVIGLRFSEEGKLASECVYQSDNGRNSISRAAKLAQVNDTKGVDPDP